MKDESGFSRTQRLLLVLAGALIVVLLPVVVHSLGLALDDPYTIEEGIVLDSGDGPVITLGTEINPDSEEPFPDNNTVDLSPEIVFWSNGETQATVNQTGSDGSETVLTNLDVQNNTLEVDVGGRDKVAVQGDADSLAFDDPDPDQGTVLSVTQSSSGTSNITIWGLEPDTVAVVDADSGDGIKWADTTNGVATFSVTGNTSVELHSPGDGPDINRFSASPEGEQSTPADTLEVDVSDDLGGDVEVEFALDGQVVGNDTVSDSGTASVSISEEAAGSHNWTVTATDQFGETSTETFEYSIPDELEIRDVESGDLVQNANATVEFYVNDIVVERQAPNGIVNMSGIPVDDDIIAVIEADNYTSRTIVIPTIFDPQTAWLLHEDKSTVLNEFQIDDATGQFGVGETRLEISRPIADGAGDQTFQLVAGDYFGADGVFGTELEVGQRYRLSVVNDDGDRRSVGTYTPTSAGLRTIEIGSTSWEAPEDESYATEAKYVTEEIDGEEEESIVFEFGDPHDIATDLNIRIEHRFNSSNVIYEETVPDPADYRLRLPLNENQTGQQWVVNYTVTVDGEERRGMIPVGPAEDVGLPLDSKWLEGFVVVAIVILAAAFPGPLSSIGGIVVVGIAGMAILAGWLTIPIGAWFAAATIATLGIVRARESNSI